MLILVCIIHKLKTGCQWRFLFIDNEVFKTVFSWQLVYYYYNKWSKAGVFEKMYHHILIKNRLKLAVSLLHLDGTQTLAKKGGLEVGYQYRKKGNSSNMLILTDANGYPLGLGGTLSGNHNDLYEVNAQFGKMYYSLLNLGINLKGSFLNADKGFDSKSFRRHLKYKGIQPNIKENLRNRTKGKRGVKRFFDEVLYKKRFVNERLFAWMDSFKSLLNRFETSTQNWESLHFLAFSLILINV